SDQRLYYSVLATPSVMRVFYHPTPTSNLYTLSLHDALPILGASERPKSRCAPADVSARLLERSGSRDGSPGDLPSSQRMSNHPRSEEHTSELQSHLNLVCRLLLEKKKRM